MVAVPASGAGGARPRASIRTAVVWELLRDIVADADAATADATGGGPLRVLDVGGGSGGFAVPLAQLGCEVVVVDPSPDSLAALERRAAEADAAAHVRGVQGDVADLADIVEAASTDLVLCHSVLEVVDDPVAALAAVERVLRPGGLVSILVANRVAAVAARVAAGRLGEARRMIDHASGTAGEGDPLRQRYTIDELKVMVSAAGLVPGAAHAIRVFTDLVPPALLDGDAQATTDLLQLEQAASIRPDYLAVASQLHLLATSR